MLDRFAYEAELSRADWMVNLALALRMPRPKGSAWERSIITRQKNATVQIFYGQKLSTPSTTFGWLPWIRPRNVSVVEITTIGGASGGGGGFTAASASARGGGGGGASGALARGLFPARVLPPMLYLLPGSGGVGGAASTIGTAGGRSYVTDTPNTAGVAANTILVSGAVAAAGGSGGTAAGSRAGGAAETIATNVLGMYMGFASGLTFIAGMAGTASGALGAAGVALTFGAVGIPMTGGTGGGSVTTTNTNVAGGLITGAGLIPTLAGGVAAGGAGNNGWDLEWPFIGTGGTGGGTAGASGTAGRGGDGAACCGGGGGGSGVAGGAGGDGGSGLIMIVSW